MSYVVVGDAFYPENNEIFKDPNWDISKDPTKSTPKASSIFATIPPSSIRVVKQGTSREYYEGTSGPVRSIFMSLQTALGVAVDGQIGANTVRAAVARADTLWRASIRSTPKLAQKDEDYLGYILNHPQPGVVASIADQLTRIFGGSVSIARDSGTGRSKGGVLIPDTTPLNTPVQDAGMSLWPFASLGAIGLLLILWKKAK